MAHYAIGPGDPPSGNSATTSSGEHYGGDGSGDLLDWTQRIAYEINEYNPVSLVWDAVSGYFTGADRFGNPLNTVSSTYKLAAALPIGKAAGAVNNIGSKAVRSIPTITEQVASLSKQLGKNSVNIKTPGKVLHFDLKGAIHKGVPTPHVQRSLPNSNPNTGQIFWNKDRQWIRPMTQQDIRIIRKYFKTK